MPKNNSYLQIPYVAANIDRFSGLAKKYDYYRPSVPKVIVDILTQLACVSRPQKVVDIGSGTGLSTRVWTKYANEVIGIEPNDDMLNQARSHSNRSNIHYQKGLSLSTDLSDNCADIVTVVEAFHWMEPADTLKEIARILRPGGVFAAISYDWPPTVNLEAETLVLDFENRARKLLEETGRDKIAHKWPKEEYLLQIKNSGLFQYTKEIAVHGIEKGNADRMIGLVLYQSNIQFLLKNGTLEERNGLSVFCREMKHILGENPQPMYFTFRLRLGIKSI